MAELEGGSTLDTTEEAYDVPQEAVNETLTFSDDAEEENNLGENIPEGSQKA